MFRMNSEGCGRSLNGDTDYVDAGSAALFAKLLSDFLLSFPRKRESKGRGSV